MSHPKFVHTQCGFTHWKFVHYHLSIEPPGGIRSKSYGARRLILQHKRNGEHASEKVGLKNLVYALDTTEDTPAACANWILRFLPSSLLGPRSHYPSSTVSEYSAAQMYSPWY